MNGYSGAILSPGTLYVCGTPIGNLSDASFRLLEVLQDVDLVACEDTRRTMKLLSYYEIKKPLVSLHEHIEVQRSGMILKKLAEGKSVALVSDAGMPLISDPGAVLVQQARDKQIPVAIIPGPSAVTGALSLSGFNSSRFIFAGFPPRRSAKRQRFFLEWIKPHVPLVFFESPYRILKSLADLKAVFPTIQVSLCHEMTKMHESVITGNLLHVYKKLEGMKIKGEWTVVVYLENLPNKKEAD